jgi:hypothetical protein
MNNFTQMAEDWIRRYHGQGPPAAALQDRLPHDPAEWRQPFVQWLDSACIYDSRCFGGVSCLHVAFCEWSHANEDVGCNRSTFERMLEELGFLIVDGLVSGVAFREDFEAVSNVSPSKPYNNRLDIPRATTSGKSDGSQETFKLRSPNN